MIRPLLLLLAALALPGCVASHRTRTVGKGHLGTSLSLGGPMQTQKGVAPMPMAFLGGRYGLRDDLDVSLDLNLTAPIILGLPLDAQTAVQWAPIQPGLRGQAADRGFSAVGAASVDWVSDFSTGFRAFPALTLTGAYRWPRVAPYLGLTTALDFYRPFERKNPLSLNPYVGAEVFLGKGVGLDLELQIREASTNLWGENMQWVVLSRNEEKERTFGVLTPMIGVTWDFDPHPATEESQ